MRRKLSKFCPENLTLTCCIICCGEYAVCESKTLLWLHEDISHAANNGSVHNVGVFAVFSNLNIVFLFFYCSGKPLEFLLSEEAVRM